MNVVRFAPLIALAAGMFVLLAAACGGDKQEQAQAAEPSASPTATATATATPTSVPPTPTPTATPFAGKIGRLALPRFGVNAPIEELGVTADNYLDTPKDENRAVGWYYIYDRPGWRGNAVFSAHVYYGGIPGPFVNLAKSVEGDKVNVTMEDGTTYEGMAVNWLIALAVVLVATQPLLQRALARRRASEDAGPFRIGPGRLVALLSGAYATGTYGGYFAASQGVLQIGIFGLLIPESLQRLNALKNVLTMAVNAVAAIAYVIVAPDRVEWGAAPLDAVGALAGGFVGSSYGRRLPATVLRAAIVVLGLTAIAVLLSR